MASLARGESRRGIFLAEHAKGAKKDERWELRVEKTFLACLASLARGESRRGIFLAEHAKDAKKREEKKNLSQRAQRTQRRGKKEEFFAKIARLAKEEAGGRDVSQKRWRA